jgi:ABC-type multidrug transport system fused ATPase/permease subunit
MFLNIEQTVIDYLNKFGFLFENDTLVLLEDIKIDKKIKEIKEKYKKKKDKLKEYRDKSLDKLKEIFKDATEQYGQEYADELNEKIFDIVEKKKKRIRQLYLIQKNLLNAQEAKEIEKAMFKYKATAIISGVALASLIIYTAHQTYKETNNKYKKNCEKKIGIDKDRCILKNRIVALKKRLNFLNGASIKCNKSKDPIKCKDKLDEEILRLKDKLVEDTKNLYMLASRKTDYGY